MSARNFALFSGVFFIAIGILGFVPGIVSAAPTQPDPELLVSTGYGYLFGLFPTNLVHNLVHLAVGFWGVTSARDSKPALLYCQVFAILYSLIAVMGILPVASTTFGLMPIYGGNVVLNLVAAAVAAYYGFVKLPGIGAAPKDKTSKAVS